MPLPVAVAIAGGLSALSKRIQITAVVAGVVSGITYMFKTKTGYFVMVALAWLGLNFGTIMLVVEPALDLMYGYAQGSGSGGGQYAAAALQWMGVMNLDRAITMVGSSIMARKMARMGQTFVFARGYGAPLPT